MPRLNQYTVCGLVGVSWAHFIALLKEGSEPDSALLEPVLLEGVADYILEGMAGVIIDLGGL